MKKKRLSEVLGKKCYERLVNEFGGRRVWIPKNGNPGFRDTSSIQKRNERIISLAMEGKPVKEIMAAVKEEKIDLIIMSAHEEGRFEHYMFGRTVEELTRKMPCSILLVKYNPWQKV